MWETVCLFWILYPGTLTMPWCHLASGITNDPNGALLVLHFTDKGTKTPLLIFLAGPWRDSCVPLRWSCFTGHFFSYFHSCQALGAMDIFSKMAFHIDPECSWFPQMLWYNPAICLPRLLIPLGLGIAPSLWPHFEGHFYQVQFLKINSQAGQITWVFSHSISDKKYLLSVYCFAKNYYL